MVNIIKYLPNLKHMSLTFINDGRYRTGSPSHNDVTPIFSAFTKASKRSALVLNNREFGGIIRLNPEVAHEACLGLQTLDLLHATSFEEKTLLSLIRGAAPTLRRLSVPLQPPIPLPVGHTPHLCSFTRIQAQSEEVLDSVSAPTTVLARFLEMTPSITSLEVGGPEIGDALQYCSSLQSLTFEVAIATKLVNSNLSFLSVSARSHLRELDISLTERQSGLDLEATFASLPALEELTIAGWYRDVDFGPAASVEEESDEQARASILSAMSEVNVPRSSLKSETNKICAR